MALIATVNYGQDRLTMVIVATKARNRRPTGDDYATIHYGLFSLRIDSYGELL